MHVHIHTHTHIHTGEELESEAASLSRQLGHVRVRLDRLAQQRDHWRDRCLLYERACSQLQVRLGDAPPTWSTQGGFGGWGGDQRALIPSGVCARGSHVRMAHGCVWCTKGQREGRCRPKTTLQGTFQSSFGARRLEWQRGQTGYSPCYFW